MRKIERVIGEKVSPEMQDMAKNLRNLATLVEGGTCVAVAIAWVQTEDNGPKPNETFCGDEYGTTLLGATALLQFNLAKAIHDDDHVQS